MDTKSGWVVVKELGMLKMWKPRWCVFACLHLCFWFSFSINYKSLRRASFSDGVLDFFENNTATTPTRTFILPNHKVLVEPQPKEKLNRYSKLKASEITGTLKYKANHFHIIFVGSRYCVSCDLMDEVSNWFDLLKKWDRMVF